MRDAMRGVGEVFILPTITPRGNKLQLARGRESRVRAPPCLHMFGTTHTHDSSAYTAVLATHPRLASVCSIVVGPKASPRRQHSNSSLCVCARSCIAIFHIRRAPNWDSWWYGSLGLRDGGNERACYHISASPGWRPAVSTQNTALQSR